MIIGKEQSVSANGYKILIELGKIMEEMGKALGLEHIESIDIGLQKASELGAIPTEHIVIFKK